MFLFTISFIKQHFQLCIITYRRLQHSYRHRYRYRYPYRYRYIFRYRYRYRYSICTIKHTETSMMITVDGDSIKTMNILLTLLMTINSTGYWQLFIDIFIYK